MKKLTLDINGQMLEGHVASSRGTLWVHMNGKTFVYEPPRRQSRKGSKSATAHPGEVSAPMPGKIIKTLVKSGDKVQIGQVLIVMEAMKMEYTLKAQTEGVVSEVNCEASQQVALGQVLVKLDVV